MSAKKLFTVAVASILLLSIAAAVGAAAPADHAHQNASDRTDENTDVTADDFPDENATVELPGEDPELTVPHAGDERSENAAPASDGVGPTDRLPPAVPDHVSSIHGTIDSFLGGTVENLGSSLSELFGGGASDKPAPAENSTAVDRS